MGDDPTAIKFLVLLKLGPSSKILAPPLATICVPEFWNSESHLQRPKVMSEIFQAAAALGGTLSGEHGIGITKKKYLSLFIDEEQLRLMKDIKRNFDPNLILNPGKIFDI